MSDSHPPTAEVDYDDIQNAFMFVSGGMEAGNTAWLDRRTGQIYYKSPAAGLDERLPDDDDDGIFSESDYTAIPNQYDLDLGQNLVFRFVEAKHPEA